MICHKTQANNQTGFFPFGYNIENEKLWMPPKNIVRVSYNKVVQST